MERNQTILKLNLYILSLLPLFLLVVIVSVKIPKIWNFSNKEWWFELIKDNYLLSIMLIFVLYALLVYARYRFQFKGQMNSAVKVKKVNHKNFEHLTILTTYIIPLITIDFSKWQGVVIFFSILIVVGIIFIRSNLYLANPTLALFGYNLYEIQYEGKGRNQKVMVISLQEIEKNDYIEYKNFDQENWYVRVIDAI